MGQKVDPRGMRIGIVKTWDSKWFARKGKEYLNNFHEDLKIREYIKKNYYQAGISSIAIERVSENEITIIVSTGKAAVLIGRKGAEITALRAKLENMTGKKVFVKALEIKNPNRDAQLVAESIATAIEKRVAYKRAVQQAIQRAEKAGVLGIKVMTSGRLNGAEIARSEWTLSGRVPLHTLRADVDYATATAHTTYGALGIKVWIFNGEVLPTKKEGGTK
ncbi:30S ribosomal protein S3 [Streptobacillus moniliformis]|uniref:Small ribosomal subunit protein uS3 n=1 Tax=Streptobacillus moniliformis (strain ATCC 14647 / DSM 12112 / NCTC 10651 / 9901) TaxID=519441 RepID=D1AVH2_STRM9|nr:30S ribosomal protein S3 [Streptobacillus moniliformis]ACZ01732.1 ribosomal protein S3 [Streptobacillus moniliformis DSM 12112]AVL43276.1 30S ribosomal protein S3 [Streptobacillus moniliformis]QXW66398.1 30S ribosomal protein S3 [Streptobacillus moniliformis]SQA13086.1 BS2 [Streptobacillus moniliformis]SQA14671.1 BS2 [Streptobacillus moniliformis]